MKTKLIYFVVAVAVLFSSCTKVDEVTLPQAKVDSLVSGAAYANDVYYSLKNGVVKTAPRAEWDLAFTTSAYSVSILINSGTGVSLYKLGAIADFDTFGGTTTPTTGAYYTDFTATTWYNNSAFEQGINTSNALDQGWGLYNTTTHSVTGQYTYALKLADGTWKKIAIVSHLGSSPYTFTFKVADFTVNASATTKTIDAGTYTTKNFVYYKVSTDAVVDREPAKTDWDVVFTKFYDTSIPYTVTGILTNEGLGSVKLAAADSAKVYSTATFSKKVSNIGSDWKVYANSVYSIANPFYLVQTKDGDTYRIKFKAFKSSTGTTVFEKLKLN